MSHRKCPHCASGVMDELSDAKVVKLGRRSVHVEGLVKYVCSTCQGEAVSREQFKRNRAATLEAIERANRNSVDPTYLREFRERYDLTQKAASELFGAGQSAFGKWESEQSALSTPAALLVKCATEVPGVAEYLADLNGVTLGQREFSFGTKPQARLYLVKTEGQPTVSVNVEDSDHFRTPVRYGSDTVSIARIAK